MPRAGESSRSLDGLAWKKKNQALQRSEKAAAMGRGSEGSVVCVLNYFNNSRKSSTNVRVGIRFFGSGSSASTTDSRDQHSNDREDDKVFSALLWICHIEAAAAVLS